MRATDPDTAVDVLFSRGSVAGSRSAWFAAEGVAAGESLVVDPEALVAAPTRSSR